MEKQESEHHNHVQQQQDEIAGVGLDASTDSTPMHVDHQVLPSGGTSKATGSSSSEQETKQSNHIVAANDMESVAGPSTSSGVKRNTDTCEVTQSPITPETPANKRVRTDTTDIMEELYEDLDMLRTVFPDVNADEIFTYLGMHRHKPAQERIMAVINDLLPTDDTDNGDASGDTDFHKLCQLVPDCDLFHIINLLQQRCASGQTVDVEVLANELLDAEDYPRQRDVLQQHDKKGLRQMYLNGEMFNMIDFLKTYPDPSKYFNDTSRKMSNLYFNHAVRFLSNEFRMVTIKYITKVLQTNANHFTPALDSLRLLIENRTGEDNDGIFVDPPREGTETYPEEVDEEFFREVSYIQNRDNILGYMKTREAAHEEMVNIAREHNELHTCACCYDDEVLATELVECNSGTHKFCETCIRRGTEAAIGDGKSCLKCMENGCKEQFSIAALHDVLAPKIFALVVERIQLEELDEANVENLVKCPFCSFAIIIDDPEVKVLKCQRPSCRKVSCRMCGEPDHVPLRCEEVEKKGETCFRTYLEKKMTEALLRKCPSCSKVFIKTSGCNKMKCVCGASMCYICKEPVRSYAHFDTGEPNTAGRCPIMSNDGQQHREEMKKAIEDAKKQFAREFGQTALDKNLKNDPSKDVEQIFRDNHEIYGNRRQRADNNLLLNHLLAHPQFMRVQHIAERLWIARANEHRMRENYRRVRENAGIGQQQDAYDAYLAARRELIDAQNEARNAHVQLIAAAPAHRPHGAAGNPPRVVVAPPVAAGNQPRAAVAPPVAAGNPPRAAVAPPVAAGNPPRAGNARQVVYYPRHAPQPWAANVQRVAAFQIDDMVANARHMIANARAMAGNAEQQERVNAQLDAANNAIHFARNLNRRNADRNAQHQIELGMQEIRRVRRRVEEAAAAAANEAGDQDVNARPEEGDRNAQAAAGRDRERRVHFEDEGDAPREVRNAYREEQQAYQEAMNAYRERQRAYQEAMNIRHQADQAMNVYRDRQRAFRDAVYAYRDRRQAHRNAHRQGRNAQDAAGNQIQNGPQANVENVNGNNALEARNVDVNNAQQVHAQGVQNMVLDEGAVIVMGEPQQAIAAQRRLQARGVQNVIRIIPPDDGQRVHIQYNGQQDGQYHIQIRNGRA